MKLALAAGAAALAVLVPATPAAAQNDLYNDFQGDGAINPCAYSPGQLQDGLNNVPPDLQQYAPGFADQLRAGLEAQCGGGAVPAPGDSDATLIPGFTGAGGGGGGPANPIPDPPAPKPNAIQKLGNLAAPPVSAVPGGSDPPDGLLPLLGAGAVLLGVAVFGGLRMAGFSTERFTRPLRASFADAGGRTADAFATAADFLRFGR